VFIPKPVYSKKIKNKQSFIRYRFSKVMIYRTQKSHNYSLVIVYIMIHMSFTGLFNIISYISLFTISYYNFVPMYFTYRI